MACVTVFNARSTQTREVIKVGMFYLKTKQWRLTLWDVSCKVNYSDIYDMGNLNFKGNVAASILGNGTLGPRPSPSNTFTLSVCYATCR